MVKVRFNLGRGDNYKKWQLKGATGNVVHYDPDDTVLILMDVRLTNQPSAAKKIHGGANKTVCAWIEAGHVIPYKKADVPLEYLNAYKNEDNQLRYNPRVAPNWQDNQGNNVDNHSFPVVATIGKAVFEIPKQV